MCEVGEHEEPRILHHVNAILVGSPPLTSNVLVTPVGESQNKTLQDNIPRGSPISVFSSAF